MNTLADALDSTSNTVFSPLRLLNVVLRRWQIAVGLPVVAGIIALSLALTLPKTFRARTTFIPEGRGVPRGSASLAGIASLAGVSLGADPTQSPQFYATLLKSQSLLAGVLLDTFPAAASVGGRMVLVDLLKVKGNSPEARIETGVRRLGGLITVEVNNSTGIVTVNVDASDSLVSSALANKLIERINAFNLETRHTQTAKRRKFVEDRKISAGDSLVAAEGAVAAWLRSNRSYGGSPDLAAELQRLQRRVDLRQEVYIGLSREVETARIEEVNSTPLITQIDAAVTPVRPRSPQPLLWTAIGLFLGVVAASAAIVLLEAVTRTREEDNPDYLETREHLSRIGLRSRATPPLG